MTNFTLSGLLNNVYVGFTGSQGIQGFTGSQGDIGFTGSAGVGFTGSQGDQGGVGFTGSQGDIGFTGSAGAGSFIFNAVIVGSSGSSDWTGSDPSIATVTVSGILSTDVPIVDIDLSNEDFGDIDSILADWSLVYRVEASDNNELKLYAFDEPSKSFTLNIKVVR